MGSIDILVEPCCGHAPSGPTQAHVFVLFLFRPRPTAIESGLLGAMRESRQEAASHYMALADNSHSVSLVTLSPAIVVHSLSALRLPTTPASSHPTISPPTPSCNGSIHPHEVPVAHSRSASISSTPLPGFPSPAAIHVMPSDLPLARKQSLGPSRGKRRLGSMMRIPLNSSSPPRSSVPVPQLRVLCFGRACNSRPQPQRIKRVVLVAVMSHQSVASL